MELDPATGQLAVPEHRIRELPAFREPAPRNTSNNGERRKRAARRKRKTGSGLGKNTADFLGERRFSERDVRDFLKLDLPEPKWVVSIERKLLQISKNNHMHLLKFDRFCSKYLIHQ